MSNDNQLRCSFCGKSSEEVHRLISAPADVPKAYICNECVLNCVVILDDDADTDSLKIAARNERKSWLSRLFS